MSANNWGICPKCKGKYTLREDYEIGISGNNFLIDYQCSCGNCGFNFEYHHIKQAYSENPNNKSSFYIDDNGNMRIKD